MKNILLVGASSAAAKSLFTKYNNDYNFTRLSRDESLSDINNFDILNPDTYLKNETLYDGVVYFPGSINLKPFKNLSIHDFNKDFEINILGIVNILKHYQSQFNKNCSIIFISSLASKVGLPFHASVSVAKSALVGLCLSLAAEFAPTFRVNCISPSMFKSEMSSRFLKNIKSEEKIRNNNPLKMIGESDDISSLINFLLSNESKWITGQNFSVDGGMSTLKL